MKTLLNIYTLNKCMHYGLISITIRGQKVDQSVMKKNDHPKIFSPFSGFEFRSYSPQSLSPYYKSAVRLMMALRSGCDPWACIRAAGSLSRTARRHARICPWPRWHARPFTDSSLSLSAILRRFPTVNRIFCYIASFILIAAFILWFRILILHQLALWFIVMFSSNNKERL